MSDLFNLYVQAGSPHGDDQPQSAIRWASSEITTLRQQLEQSDAQIAESIEVAIDMLEDYARALDSGDLDGAGHSTTSCIYEVIDELTTYNQRRTSDVM